MCRTSLPSRERGLKPRRGIAPGIVIKVAPFTGAWIETYQKVNIDYFYRVAPFTGAWIETTVASRFASAKVVSLPSRERGLKREDVADWWASRHVAPFTGAWIETRVETSLLLPLKGRSLHGSVD